MIRLVLEQAQLGESGQILVRSKLRAVMQRMEFAAVRREAAELVCTEVLTNQYKYGGGGGLFQIWEEAAPRRALHLFALDFGAGIDDLEGALADGFTTGGTMGRGLGAIQRLADASAIYSVSKSRQPGARWHGVAVWACFRREPREPEGFETGVYLRPYNDDAYTGDCVCRRSDGARLRWLHIDALGHGQEAAAVVSRLERLLEGGALESTLTRISEALRGGRGAVGLACEIDAARGEATFCGVGDISAAVVDGRKQALAFSPGVLGHAHRRLEPLAVALNPGALVITASDGIRRAWDENAFPGLWHHHPQMVALLLGNVISRANDDRSLFVARIR